MRSIGQITHIVRNVIRNIYISIAVSFLISCSQSHPNSFPSTTSVEITNPLNQSRKDVAVFIPLEEVPASFIVRSNETQLPAQNYGDGIIVILDSLKANEKRKLTIYYNSNESFSNEVRYRKRTQADLIQGNIPAIESEKIAYRFSTGIDVLGKQKPDMMLLGVDNENLSIIKNANWTSINDSTLYDIQQNGDLFSQVQNSYSEISVCAGSRLIRNRINGVDSMSTGLKKLTKVYSSKGDNHSYGYIATYGNKLGLVILFAPGDFVSFGQNSEVNLRTLNSTLEYHFGAAWALEPKGIATEADFMKWVERSARELANPITVHVN